MSESFADTLRSANDLLARPVAPRPDLSQRSGVAGAGVLSHDGLRGRLGLGPATGVGFVDELAETLATMKAQRSASLSRSAQDGALKRGARLAAARALAQSQYPDGDEKALGIATRLNMGEGRALFDPKTLANHVAAIRTSAAMNPTNDPYRAAGDPRLAGAEDIEREVSSTDMRRALSSDLGRAIDAYRSGDPQGARNAMGLGLIGKGIGRTYRGIAEAADPFTGGTMEMALGSATNRDGTPLTQTQRQQLEEVFGQGALNAATAALGAGVGAAEGGANALANAFRARSLAPLLKIGAESGGTAPEWIRGAQALEHGLSMADLGMGLGQAGSVAIDPTRDPEERRGAALSAALMAGFMTPAAAAHLIGIPAARRAAEATRLVPELEGVHPGAFADSVLRSIKNGADPRDISMLLGQDLSRADFDARRGAQLGARVERADTLGMRHDPETGRWGTTEGAFDGATGDVAVRDDATSAMGTTHELQHRIERDANLGADALKAALGPEGWKALQEATYADAFKRAVRDGVGEAGAKEYGRYYSSDDETSRYWIGRYMEDGPQGVRGAGRKGAQRAATKALAGLMDERGIGAHGGAMLDFDRAAAHGLAGGAGFDAEGRSLYDPQDRARAAAEGRAQERQDRLDVAQGGGTAEQRARFGTPELVRGVHDGKRFVGLTEDELAELDRIDAEHEAAANKAHPTRQMADEAAAKATADRASARAKVLDAARAREANDRRAVLGQGPLESHSKADVSSGVSSKPERALGGHVVGETELYTPDGKQTVRVRTKVADRSELLVSHGPDGAPNPEYPAFAQPRDRSLPGERAKVDQQARDLNPDLLTRDFGATDRGAPLVGSDGVVESGNGRVLTLDRAKEINPEGYARYVEALRAKHPEAKGIKDPVLVQERVGEIDPETRRRIAGASNESSSSAMNSVETARQDASRLPEGIGERFDMTGRTVEDSLQSPKNRDLAEGFVRALPESERAAMFDTDGGLSVQAKGRFARALAAKALGEGAADVLYRQHLEGDVLQRTARGLEMASPELLRMRAAADGGNGVAKGMGDAIVQALRFADEARGKMGGKAAEWFEQGALSGLRDPDAMRIGKMLVESPNQEATADLVRSLARAATDSSGGMFGEEMAFGSVRDAVDSMFGDRAIAPDVQRSVSFDATVLGEQPGEEADPVKMKNYARAAAAADIANGPMVHQGQGWSIGLTNKDARGHWLLNSTSLWKKRLAAKIRDVMEDATYDRQIALTKPATQAKQEMHVFKNTVDIGGDVRDVRLIVRKDANGDYFLYDVQEDPHQAQRPVGLPQTQTGSQPTGPNNIVHQPPPGASPQTSISFDTPDFRRWFGESKLVGEDGEPLVMYHGTASREVEAFDPARVGSGADRGKVGDLGAGYYFTEDPDYADQYARPGHFLKSYAEKPADAEGSILPLVVRAESPLTLDAKAGGLVGDLSREHAAAYHRGDQAALAAWQTRVREAGFDSVISRDGEGRVFEGVVFDPNQLKSAIGNDGSFSRDDPRLTRSMSFEGGADPSGEGRGKPSSIARILDQLGVKRIGRDDPTVSEPAPEARRSATQGLNPDAEAKSGEPAAPPKTAENITEPSLFDGMGLARRDSFDLSLEQKAQENVGDRARQSDVADRGGARGVEFQGKTYRSWEEARRHGSVLADRTDILARLKAKDPGAGIGDVERAAAMEEMGDLDARLDDLDRRAAEARDAGDHSAADMHEGLAEGLRERYADLAGQVMDLTSDNGRNLAATRMFVDRAGGDVERNLRRARAEAKRQLTAKERRSVSDAARAIGALSQAVDKERARSVAHAEASLGDWRGKTVALKDLGKTKRRSASGAVAEPKLDPVEALTRIAQNVAALGGVDPADLQKYARERLGIHLDDDAAAELMRRGGERHANPKPETPNQERLDAAKRRLAKAHEEVKETTGREFVEGLYRAGLLSTLRASQASLAGNAVSRAFEDVARMPATMIDAALSLRTGERTVSVAGTVAGERAAYSRDAAKASLDAVLHGAGAGEIGKYDQARTLDYRPTRGRVPAVDAPFRAVSWGVNKVFDLLAAADRPAFRGEMERSLIEQATLDAKNKGLKGEDVRTYVRSKLGANVAPEIVLRAAMAQSDASPGSLRDLVRRAKEQAEESILANSSPATKAAAAVGQIPVAGPLFLPFPKIPTNAVARGLEWSPAGVVYGLARTLQVLHAGDVAAQKKAANALARGALGSTALLYLGYKGRELGFLSGPSSSDQGMRATEEAAGQQGSSVKAGSRWLSYRDVPQTMVVGMGAALYDAQQAARLQGKEWKSGDTASALTGGAADSAMDLPTLQGAKDATQALQEVSRAKGEGDDPIGALKDTKLVQGLGGSILPRGEQEAATAGDPYQREASSFAERFQAGTGGRAALAKKVDALGRPLERTTGLASQVRGLSPDQAGRQKDALAQELLRLRVPMAPPQKVRSESRPDRDRDSAEFAERKARIGGAIAGELRRLMGTAWYGGATDAQRREEILAVRREARGEAAADLRDERERRRK